MSLQIISWYRQISLFLGSGSDGKSDKEFRKVKVEFS